MIKSPSGPFSLEFLRLKQEAVLRLVHRRFKVTARYRVSWKLYSHQGHCNTPQKRMHILQSWRRLQHAATNCDARNTKLYFESHGNMRIRETREVFACWWSCHEADIPSVMKHTFSRPRSSRLCALQTPRFCLNIQFFIYSGEKRGAKRQRRTLQCAVVLFTRTPSSAYLMGVWRQFSISTEWWQGKKRRVYTDTRREL